MPTDYLRSLSSRLDREWDRLRRRPGVVATARSWRVTDRGFGSLDELLVLAGHRADPTPDADTVLRRLVAVAPAEPLACRIVLQRILPGLLAIVRSEQARDPRIDAFDLIVGEAWISITRYRVDARPTDVAARLLSDARHRAFTSGRRRRVVEEIVTDDGAFAEVVVDDTATAFDEAVAVIHEARRAGLADEHVSAVADFLSHGSSRRVAMARDITERAARYRQSRAVTRVRRLVAAA
jgi:hypothetical protein